MYTLAEMEFKGVGIYSQSKRHTTPHNDGESDSAYEVRTWRERMHYHPSDHPLTPGQIFIPPNQFQEAVLGAATFMSLGIPSKGKSTYTKHIRAGLIIPEGITLPDLKDEADSETFFVPSNGQKGGGKRVDKTFCAVHKWRGILTVHVLDPVLMQTIHIADVGNITVLQHHFMQAGNFVGIGRFRPAVGGYYGRFTVEDVVYKDSPKPKDKGKGKGKSA